MKYKFIFFMLATILLLNLVNSEMQLWNTVNINSGDSTVSNHLFYSFEDTSSTGVGKNKDIPIKLIAVIQPLPYNLTLGSVDWCNLTVSHFKNIYSSNGELINTTRETTSYFYSGTPINQTDIYINARSKDSVEGDIICHYTNPNELYLENILVGRFTTYMPSFECNKCEDYTLEEQSGEIEKTEQLENQQISIFGGISSIIGFNYQIWIILDWVIKIAFIILSLGLIFAFGYYIFNLFKRIENEI